MIINFASDAAIAEASVEVDESISIPVFTRRLESLLDCSVPSEAAEWVLKYSAPLSLYSESPQQAVSLLCDKIASIDPASGEVIGVLKIKRRSVTAGHAKVRIVPNSDSLQLICRHTSGQGLKAVWKSVLWRLRPQHGAPGVVGNDAEWAELEALYERQGWSLDSSGCYIYANAVDMQMSCVDGAVLEVPNFRVKGNNSWCNRASELRQKLNGKKFRIITSNGQLYLKFAGSVNVPTSRSPRW
jgi:hypothetical protein